ncbi:MAG: UDP-N-acetylmuramate dehydrogenase [Hungatella sp.]
MQEFQSQLERILSLSSIRLQEPMKAHTTFRIGGPADYYVSPRDEKELMGVCSLCRHAEVPYSLLGNGSNLLVSDEGYRGVMITLDAWDEVRIQETTVTAGAGILLSKLAKKIAEASLTGFEFAAGIPGSLGGALVMNAGAYGSEMREIVTGAKVMTREGEIRELSGAELELGYRTSCIPAKDYIVLEGTFELQHGEAEAIYRRMEELSMQRKSKQPLEYPSAGSTFKRPSGYFAGKLIEDAGLRGFCIGGAQVSEKHCGFVINRGGASAADVMNLCKEVQHRVEEQFGVVLEMEVKRLGSM